MDQAGCLENTQPDPLHATDFQMLSFIRSLESKIYAIMDYLQEFVDLPCFGYPNFNGIGLAARKVE
jgi:hypothetical protein